MYFALDTSTSARHHLSALINVSSVTRVDIGEKSEQDRRDETNICHTDSMGYFYLSPNLLSVMNRSDFLVLLCLFQISTNTKRFGPNYSRISINQNTFDQNTNLPKWQKNIILHQR